VEGYPVTALFLGDSPNEAGNDFSIFSEKSGHIDLPISTCELRFFRVKIKVGKYPPRYRRPVPV
jgi:hypothetical protein